MSQQSNLLVSQRLNQAVPVVRIAPPSSRAGSISSACKNANSAENVMPTSRNGNANSQTKGHSTSASNASGQHSTHSRHHSSRRVRDFIAVLGLIKRCTCSDLHDAGVHPARQAVCDETGMAAMKRPRTRPHALATATKPQHRQAAAWCSRGAIMALVFLLDAPPCPTPACNMPRCVSA